MKTPPLDLTEFGIPADRRSFGCRELAELFLVSPEHVRKLCASQELAAEPIPGRKPNSVDYWRIPVASLAKFIRKRMVRPKPKPVAKRRKKVCKVNA